MLYWRWSLPGYVSTWYSFTLDILNSIMLCLDEMDVRESELLLYFIKMNLLGTRNNRFKTSAKRFPSHLFRAAILKDRISGGLLNTLYTVKTSTFRGWIFIWPTSSKSQGTYLSEYIDFKVIIGWLIWEKFKESATRKKIYIRPTDAVNRMCLLCFWLTALVPWHFWPNKLTTESG